MPLTTNQQAAVDHSGGHLQIIASAGSGKTEVVARRVAGLLEREWPSGLRPAHIVAFTFTEKAAAELKGRIVLRVRETAGDIPGRQADPRAHWRYRYVELAACPLKIAPRSSPSSAVIGSSPSPMSPGTRSRSTRS